MLIAQRLCSTLVGHLRQQTSHFRRRTLLHIIEDVINHLTA